MKFARITVNPLQMGGVPCIRGLRIPVATVIEMMADGMTPKEILDAFPDLEAADIDEALHFAADAVRERQLPLVTVGGSPMLSNQFENCLGDAFRQARKTGHGHLTIEHLLMAILDTPEVCEILRACRCDPVKVRQQLEEHLVESTPPRPDAAKGHALPPTFQVQPTLGLQRVLQRAVFHVKSSGKKEVGVADILVAVFSEKQSHSVYLLNHQNITRLDVVNYISHGLTRP